MIRPKNRLPNGGASPPHLSWVAITCLGVLAALAE
jgi:hypothetical protein